MPTNASRTRSRDRSARQSPAPSKPSSPTEANVDPATRILPDATADDAAFDSPYGRYNYMNYDPTDDVWRASDFLSIAKIVYETDDIRPFHNSSSSSSTTSSTTSNTANNNNNSNNGGAAASTNVSDKKNDDKNKEKEKDKDKDKDATTNGKPKIPEALSRKSITDLRDVTNHMLKSLQDKEITFAPSKCPRNLLAVIASEYTFMATHAHERNLALFKLVTSRNNLTEANKTKEELIKEQNKLNMQIEKEKEKKNRFIERKLGLVKEKDNAKLELEKKRQHVDTLLQTLEKSKINDLEVRRRLDRIQLKVGALRGKMVVPTVDQLLLKEVQRSPPSNNNNNNNNKDNKNNKNNNDNNSECNDIHFDIINSDPTELHPFTKFGFQSVLYHPWTPDDSSSSPSLSTDFGSIGQMTDDNDNDNEGFDMDIDMDKDKNNHKISAGESSDDTEIDMDEEAMEYRLLKNRLAMVENEAAEWKATLHAERCRYEMAARAKSQLEDEVYRLKHGTNGKGSTNASKLNAHASANAKAEKERDKDTHPYSKIKAAVRASISTIQMDLAENPPQKTIKKGRKTKKPCRGLVADDRGSK